MAPVKELSENEKQIFESISNNDLANLKVLMAKVQKPDIFDENGMTPLQHAAYKGNKTIVQYLLDQGADVNSSRHVHMYTALHFAALSGNADLCRDLLLAGAKTQTTNTVGRTPSQMAAFVGNHACVATINNFIPKSDLDYYTTIQGLQKEPILKPYLADAVHKFITQTNVNPVRIAMNLQKSVFLDHLKEVKSVLESMRTREMTRGMDTNEVMAFKYHYLAYVLEEITKACERNAKGDGSTSIEKKDNLEENTIDLFIKKLLKTNKDGHMDYMHCFITDCVREFPFRECTIFRQMVSSLASPDPPFALNVISTAINGQRGFASTVPVCVTCGEDNPPKKCSKCKEVQYCDRECQRLHWFLHKKACARSSTTKKDEKQIPDAELLSAQVQNLLSG